MPNEELTFDEVKEWMIEAVGRVGKTLRLLPESPIKDILESLFKPEVSCSNESVAFQLWLYRWAEKQGFAIRADKGAAFYVVYQQVSNVASGAVLQANSSLLDTTDNVESAAKYLADRSAEATFTLMGIEVDEEAEMILAVASSIAMKSILDSIGIE